MKRKLGFTSERRMLQGIAMCLTSLLLLLMVSAAVAQTRTLDRRVSYQAKGKSLLGALKDIHTMMDVRMTYNSDLIRKQPDVTVNLKEVTLGQLLGVMLNGTDLLFAEDMGGIIIYPAVRDNSTRGNLVRGIVINESRPLPGVTIMAKVSKEGTVTTADGQFTLLAGEKDEVRISMLGMKTVIIPVTHNMFNLVVKLDTVSQEMQEVTVNGYQRIDARMSTAATYKLTAAEVLEPGVASIDQMLQGKVPGLMVVNSSGSVNAKPTIRMRGTSTLVGNASPLWVIDNVIRPDPVDISATQLNTAISDVQTGNYSLIGSAVSGLNPYDIESITFLKDAAATAIYGVRAANGVIVVTTKKGKAGPMQVGYRTDFSFQQRPSYSRLNLMNSAERVAYSRQLVEDGTIFSNNASPFPTDLTYEGLLQKLNAREITEGDFNAAVAKLSTNNTDWFALLFRNAFGMRHSIDVSGGAGKTTYFGSVSYADNHSAAIKDGKQLFTGTLKMHTQVNNRLSIDYSIMGNYAKTSGYYNGQSPLAYALKTSRAMPADAYYPYKSYGWSELPPLPPPVKFNIFNEYNQTENNGSTKSIMGDFTLAYRLGKGFTFHHSTNVVIDMADQMSAAYERSAYVAGLRYWDWDYTPTQAQVNASSLPYGGIATISNQTAIQYNIRNSIDYTKDFFANRDELIMTFGNDILSNKISGTSSVQPGYFPDRGMQFFPTIKSLQDLSSYTLTRTINNTLGYYLVGTYSLNNKYVLSGTVRTNGSNRFGQYSNARFLPVYGVSGKWNAANESWLTDNRFVSGLAFTASFGTQGSVTSAVGPELIATYPTKSTKDNLTGIPILTIKSLPYPDLRWEKTYQWNFGTNMSFFNRRLELQVNYYIKKSVDLITTRNIPWEYGIGEMYVNAGVMSNKGLEISTVVQVLRRKNTSLMVQFMNSWNKNSVVESDTRNNYLNYLDGTAIVPGIPRGGFYSIPFSGLNPVNGAPQFNMPDAKTGETDPAKYLVYSGQILPPVSGSVSPSFRYKNFNLSMDLYYALGSRKRLNPLFPQGTNSLGVPAPYDNADRVMLSRWRKPGDENITNIPAANLPANSVYDVSFPYMDSKTGNRTSQSMNMYLAYDNSDFRVVNNSFVRCKSISISYTIPPAALKKMHVKGMRVGGTVNNNVFTITSKALKGQDPEIDGVGTTALPITRAYAFSLSVDL